MINEFHYNLFPYWLHVNVATQELYVKKYEKIIKTYSISTAKNGVGEIKNSYCTPRGWHTIRAKIGHNLPPNSVLISRRFTGEIFEEALKEIFPDRDWILTRIMWLSGLEVGKNRRGECDTMQRYVYIHGTPDSTKLGIPGSKGCIRMNNHDLIELFDATPCYTPIFIAE